MTRLDSTTPIQLAEIPPRLHKVVRKLCTILDGPTVAEVLALDPRDFLDRPGVGRLYAKRLVELQRVLAPRIAADGPPVLAEERPPLHAVAVTTATLSWNALTGDELKAVRKLERVLRQELTVGALLALDLKSLAREEGIGRKTAGALRRLQQRVDNEIAGGTITPSPDRLVVLPAETPLPAEVLEATLIGDFERFVERQDPSLQEIALARWGYARPQRTLEELGIEQGVTRERIRQLEAKLNELWPRALSVSRVQIRATIEALCGGELIAQLPLLTELFAKGPLVLRFLERSAGLEEYTLADETQLEIASLRPLAGLFASVPAPISVDKCLAALGGHGLSEADAVRHLAALRASGRVTIVDGAVQPRQLERRMAFAHVLAGVPDGLFWQDLIRITNARRLCAAPISEARLSSARSPWFYLSNRGSYRHVRFLDLGQLDQEAVLTRVRDYLTDRSLASANLQSITHILFPDADYYAIRYLVSTLGEAAGLYFDGRSASDTVSLHAEVARVDIPATLKQLLADAPDALTVGELAERLRSKSLPLAKKALSLLRGDVSVVRVDEQLYTTVERAFRDFDWEGARAQLTALLAQDERPAEIGWLRERFDTGGGTARSRFFLLDAVRLMARDQGWSVARTLVDRKPIRFAGLYDVFRHAHREDRTMAEILAQIERQVRVESSFGPRVLSTWIAVARSRAPGPNDDGDDPA